MLSQARAEATRLRIIDAAVVLFDERGFSGTNLNLIIRRAGVSAGAFYYHFRSKDEVAFAIIEQVAQRMADLRTALVGSPEAGLEKVIEMTFRLSAILDQDRSYWVAAYLEHTMARHDRQGIHDVSDRLRTLLSDIAGTIRASELSPALARDEAARTMLSLIYGCLAMTDLIPGGLSTRLAECWRVLLPGIVAPDSLSVFQDVLSGTEERYRRECDDGR